MEITWLGHSSLKISSGGVTLITDPYTDSLGISMGKPDADVVTISNDHPHHSNSAVVKGDPRIITGPGEYEVASFYISGKATPRTRREEDRSINTVFTVFTEGISVCHLGDIGVPLSSRQIEELGSIDVLCVPVGGVCTLDVGRAVELVNLIRPRIVIPIHYRYEGIKVELEPVEAFLTHVEPSGTTTLRKLKISATDLPRERQVALLERQI